jgi:hypothetical protein
MLRLLKWQARGQAAQNKEGLYQTDFHASSSAKWIRQNVPMSWRFLEKNETAILLMIKDANIAPSKQRSRQATEKKPVTKNHGNAVLCR